MIRDQLILDVAEEIIVDNFAGGGGASSGIEMGLGRHVDLAINHELKALKMHEANHPQTRHVLEDVFHVDIRKQVGGRRVGLAWFSPDCKHFSKAKGKKPRNKKIRGLAWIVIKWINQLREAPPRVIILENVEEFGDWCPLLKDKTPSPWRSAWFFQCFVGALKRRGYIVEWKELRACDFGAPTIRKRLFLIARCDGKPIVWPNPTHAAPDEAAKLGLKPWRTAAECIDWSIPCPSIFERKKKLVDATCRRVAKGIFRYVIDCAKPFIVPLTHQGGYRLYDIEKPVPTVTAANRGEMALVAPVMAVNTSGHPGAAADDPLRTIATGGHHMLVAPVLTEHANQKHERVFNPQDPLRTQCAEVKGGHFALVSGFLTKFRTGATGAAATEPVPTVTANSFIKRAGGAVPIGVVTASLVGCGGPARQGEPREVTKPAQTILGKNNAAVAAAHLVRQFGGSVGAPVVSPVGTTTAGGGGKTSLVVSHIEKMRGDPASHAPGQPPDAPLHTVSAQGNHFAEVRAFLIKYYGNEKEGVDLTDPMHTVTSRDRFGLVTILGEVWAIIDIGLRMLQPRELFRAQGFPDSYIIGDNPAQGLKLTKTEQVRMVGNSVCPPLACALVDANVPEMGAWTAEERRHRRHLAA